jgi:preprotein translocase subunit SecA
LVAYRQEGYQLFERLQRGIEQEVIRLLLHLEIQNQPQPLTPLPAKQNLRFRGADDSKTAGFRTEQMTAEADRQSQSSPTSEKVGRNDPCPCGSGKKYKKCHGT